MAEARYPIRLDSNAAQVANEGATALEQLRAKLEAAKTTVKDYSSSLRDLKGDSDEVKAAKKELVDKINAEKSAITADTIAIAKAGASYDKLAAAHKKEIDAAKKGAEDQKKAAKDKSDAAEKSKKDGEEAAKTAQLVAETESAALLGVVAAAAGAALAIGALTEKFASFALTSANLLRSQQLAREGFVGNAVDAEHLGNQIDELGKKVPLGRAELNALGNDLAQSGLKGKALVDSLAAVAEESSALNEKAGSQLKDLLTRGQLTNSFALGALELQGTGLKFTDVAKALAKNTKVSVEEASAALMQGRVSLGAGAEAMKDAVEEKFGGLNLRKMLDLNTIAKKLGDTFDAMTKDINLEPVLKAFAELASLFDTTNESGATLKDLVTFLGNELGGAFAKSTPGIKGFIETLEIGAIDLAIDYLDLKIKFLETFGPGALDKLVSFESGIWAAEHAMKALVAAAIPLKSIVDGVAIVAKDPGVAKNAVASAAKDFAAHPIDAVARGSGIPGFAQGLERVPRDNFVARLHKDERVLTKDEADSYNRINSTGSRAGESTAASTSFAPEITVHIQASDPARAPLEGVKENARRGVLEALEIFKLQRGLVTA